MNTKKIQQFGKVIDFDKDKNSQADPRTAMSGSCGGSGGGCGGSGGGGCSGGNGGSGGSGSV